MAFNGHLYGRQKPSDRPALDLHSLVRPQHVERFDPAVHLLADAVVAKIDRAAFQARLPIYQRKIPQCRVIRRRLIGLRHVDGMLIFIGSTSQPEGSL